MNETDVVIIGAGPAGLSAAIQLKRHGVDFILFEKDEIGGLLKNANAIENYLGFTNPVSGLEFIDLAKEQLKNYKINLNYQKVIKLQYKKNKLYIKSTSDEISCRIVVIASGTKPRKIFRTDMTNDVKELIFYEVCNMKKIKNKIIAIIGGGDAAFDYAVTLSRNNEVVIINRSERVKCLSLLFRRAINYKNITYCSKTEVKKIHRHNDGLELVCCDNNKIIKVSYLLIAAGRVPNIDFITADTQKIIHSLIMEEKLFLIGDVKNDLYRQLSVASGDGVRAAMEINRILSGEKP